MSRYLMEKLVLGPGADPASEMGPLVTAEHRDRVASYVDAGVEYPILMPMPWGTDRRLVTQLTMEAAADAIS